MAPHVGVIQSTGLFSIRDVLPGVKCEKVICWVNSVEASDRVVEVAKSFAAIGSEPCHVVMCLNPTSGHQGENRRCCSPLTPELLCRAGERLKKLYGAEVHTVVLPGHPVREVRRYASSHRADLIVIGEQGRQAERECGEQLIDAVSCAVLSLALPESSVVSETRTKEEQMSLQRNERS